MEYNQNSWLSLRYIFGIKDDVKDNIWYIDEQTVVYPAGRNLVFYNISQNIQKFINGATERMDGITAITVSSSRKYVAVAEKGDVPTISIYDTAMGKRRKLLSYEQLGSNQFISICFSHDGKYMLAQGGLPEYNLVYWHLEGKPKVLGVVGTSSPEKDPIYQCSINPQDNTSICVSGNGIFKCYKYVDNGLKQISAGMKKRDPQNYLYHAWLPDDRIIVSTESGDLIMIEGGELKAVMPESPSDGVAITCIIPFQKGFICGGDRGIVSVYEKSEEKEAYRRKTFKIDNSGSKKNSEKMDKVALGGNVGANDSEGSDTENVRVRSFALSPNQDILAVTTSTKQIYTLNLSSSDILKPEEIKFDLLAQPFHSHKITGLDTCIRKPLVVTCSKDKTIRVWNYLDHSLEIVKQFGVDVHSVAMHPSGFHILVGFQNKLSFMNLLGKDIREYKSFQVRNCPECRFSNGGQYFAAVHGNVINVYSTYTCDLLTSLRGHSGRVKCLFWMADDTRIVSVGVDGAMYEWSLKEGKESENVIKSCNYTSVVSDNNNSIYAVGTDKKLREFVNSAIQSEFDTGKYALTSLAYSDTHKILIGGMEDGSIRVYATPLSGDGTPLEETLAHNGGVTRVKMTFDESLLFSTSEDGSLCIFDVRDNGRMSKKEIAFSEEILISHADLEEKKNIITELRARVDELKADNEYDQRKKELEFNKKMMELTENFTKELNRKKDKIEELQQQNQNLVSEFEKETQAREERFREIMQKKENEANQKLMANMEQLKKLQQELEDTNRLWQQKLAQKEESHSHFIQDMQDEYEEQLRQEKELNENLKNDNEEEKASFEELRNQIEEDTDREIEDLKEHYEAKLKAERDIIVQLKGENGVMKNNEAALKKEIEDKKLIINELDLQKKELWAQINGNQKDIYALRKEIKERDETIADKEKRIFDLKKNNQELEKFKFVLNYKIGELTAQIEPRQDEIAEMKKRIKKMDEELEKYHATNANLTTTIADLNLKLQGQQREISNLNAKLKDAATYRQRIRTDLHEVVQFIQDPKLLKEHVKRIYQKHVTDKEPNNSFLGPAHSKKQVEGEEDVLKEHHRQREYLEKTVESLKKKLLKDTEKHKSDNATIMQENVMLIKEINELRKEVRTLKLQVRDKDDPMSNPALNGSLASHRRSSTTSPTVVNGYGGNDYLREIEMQKAEILRLRQRIDELEAQVAAARSNSSSSRPISRERLPPMDGFDNVQDE